MTVASISYHFWFGRNCGQFCLPMWRTTVDIFRIVNAKHAPTKYQTDRLLWLIIFILFSFFSTFLVFFFGLFWDFLRSFEYGPFSVFTWINTATTTNETNKIRATKRMKKKYTKTKNHCGQIKIHGTWKRIRQHCASNHRRKIVLYAVRANRNTVHIDSYRWFGSRICYSCVGRRQAFAIIDQ